MTWHWDIAVDDGEEELPPALLLWFMRQSLKQHQIRQLSQIAISELCVMCRRLSSIEVAVPLELCVGVGALPRFRSGRPLRDC
jgi:hypothetical protein